MDEHHASELALSEREPVDPLPTHDPSCACDLPKVADQRGGGLQHAPVNFAPAMTDLPGAAVPSLVTRQAIVLIDVPVTAPPDVGRCLPLLT